MKELEYFYEEKTKGIIVRVRARWHEYGEKSTKYFLNLEKRNHVKKHIRKLYVNDEIKTNPLCILNEVEQFYCDLYKSKNNRPDIENEIDSFLNNLNIPKLSEEQKISCEGKSLQRNVFVFLIPFKLTNLQETMEFQLNFIKNSGL